jgi:hypothetical protein
MFRCVMQTQCREKGGGLVVAVPALDSLSLCAAPFSDFYRSTFVDEFAEDLEHIRSTSVGKPPSIGLLVQFMEVCAITTHFSSIELNEYNI